MVRNTCAVYGCLNRQSADTKLSFFSLPRDEERRMKWLKAINRPDLKNKTKFKNHLVCSQHFDKSVIKYIPQLKADAIPTIAIPNEASTSVSSVKTEPISDTNTVSIDNISSTINTEHETLQESSLDISSEIATSRKRKLLDALTKQDKKKRNSMMQDRRKNGVSLLVTMETLKSV